jgi:hypothetical protein
MACDLGFQELASLNPSSKILMSRDINWISSTVTLSFMACHTWIKLEV